MYNRAKIMFIDNYEQSDHKNNRPNCLEKTCFTKSYLLKKSKSKNGKHPVIDNSTCFRVNCNKLQIGYIDDKPVPIKELLQHKVEMYVEICNYDFNKMGTRINGWNIKLLKISLLEY
jgi:hypothetical protein